MLDAATVLALLGIPIVAGLVYLIREDHPSAPGLFWPAVALGLAWIWNVFIGGTNGRDLATIAALTVITALAAAGLEAWAKAMTSK